METHLYLSVLLCAVVAVFAILAGHWFPWKLVIGRELTRIEAYAYGTACIVTLPVVIMLTLSMVAAAMMLMASTLAAGAATVGARAFDRYTETRHKNMDLQRRLNYAETGLDQSEMGD